VNHGEDGSDLLSQGGHSFCGSLLKPGEEWINGKEGGGECKRKKHRIEDESKRNRKTGVREKDPTARSKETPYKDPSWGRRKATNMEAKKSSAWQKF